MKRLVNEFRDYARLPAAELQPLNLNALVADVLQLYEAEHASVAVRADLDPVAHASWATPSSCARWCTTCCKTRRMRRIRPVRGLVKYCRLFASARTGATPHNVCVCASATMAQVSRRTSCNVRSSPYVTTKARGTGWGWRWSRRLPTNMVRASICPTVWRRRGTWRPSIAIIRP